MNATPIFSWSIYGFAVTLYMICLINFYKPGPPPTIQNCRLPRFTEEQGLIRDINIKHLTGRDDIPPFISDLHAEARKGYVLAFDTQLLRENKSLLSFLQQHIRVLQCYDLFPQKYQNIDNTCCQVRWVNVREVPRVMKHEEKAILTYEYEQATNEHLITVLYVSHKSSNLLYAEKAGLKTFKFGG